MSENRSRDYAKYDAMATEALEEILRLDASAPEGEDSDTELLLYVMGVLANRRRNTDSTGKTALEAWESFQQDYLSEEEECLEDALDRKRPAPRPRLWLRRLIAAAALMALVVCFPLTAKAFGWEEIWEVFARWAKDTFCFVSDESAEVTEPAVEYDGTRDSLQELLIKNKVDVALVPTWVPDGFVLDKIEKDVTPEQKLYRAIYFKDEEKIEIRIKTYLPSDMYCFEIEEDILEVYTANGIEYYIFKNLDQLRALWTIESYECNISGDLSLEEIKMMIDSIEKG